jgi:hypothetical protein
MPLTNIVKFFNCLVCALLGLSYLSSPAFAPTNNATQTQEPARQVVLACNTRNLSRFLGSAVCAPDPAQQFAIIRERVLNF